MLITACGGLACNILSILTLNYLGIEEIGGGDDKKKEEVKDDEEAKKKLAIADGKDSKKLKQGSAMSFEKSSN
jgi:hypothetical protein